MPALLGTLSHPRTPSEERMDRIEPPAEGDWLLVTESRVGEDE